jgi:polyribonucleotide nucleotidyltransferase
MIVEEGIRPDGRKTTEIRPIWTELDVFPRTHGSAMFKRGATQAVTITTLGSPALGQLIESIEGVENRHYLPHYSMPPYASGEAGRLRSKVVKLVMELWQKEHCYQWFLLKKNSHTPFTL